MILNAKIAKFCKNALLVLLIAAFVIGVVLISWITLIYGVFWYGSGNDLVEIEVITTDYGHQLALVRSTEHAWHPHSEERLRWQGQEISIAPNATYNCTLLEQTMVAEGHYEYLFSYELRDVRYYTVTIQDGVLSVEDHGTKYNYPLPSKPVVNGIVQKGGECYA